MPQTFTQSDYFWNQPRTKTTRKNVLAVQGMSAPQEAKIYTPTLQQKTARLGSKLAEKIVPKKTAQRFGRDLGEAVNWLTPAGNVMDAQQFGQGAQAATQRGDILGAVGNGAGLAMAALPIPGALRKPLVKGTEKALKSGIRAFHGSPHDFDKFDMSKLGTGEGAQAYGHGLYFAENEGVAKGYRDALSPEYREMLNYAGPDRSRNAASMLTMDGVSDDVILDTLKDLGAENPAQSLTEGRKIFNEVQKKGRMYEVNINASPDEFLDWDAPLSGQPEQIRAALSESNPFVVRNGNAYLGSERLGPANAGDEANFWKGAQRNGQTAWQTMLKGQPDAKPTLSGFDSSLAPRVTESLSGRGVKGIKYKDAGSRGADGMGTSNYVVFNDSIIDILRKYGLAGAAVTGTGAAALQSEPAQAQY
jgi:hypothetical protein